MLDSVVALLGEEDAGTLQVWGDSEGVWSQWQHCSLVERAAIEL